MGCREVGVTVFVEDEEGCDEGEEGGEGWEHGC